MAKVSPRSAIARIASRAAIAIGIAVALAAYCMKYSAWGERVIYADKATLGLAWLPGTVWDLQWLVCCAGLVLAAVGSVGLEIHSRAGLEVHARSGDEVRARDTPEAGKARRRLAAANGDVVGAVAMAVVAAVVLSWHVVGIGRHRKLGRPVPLKRWFGRSKRFRPVDALYDHAFQLGWDAMVPMSLLGVPTARVSALCRGAGLPYELAVKYHRWLGVATLVLIFGHFALFCLAWGVDRGAAHAWDEVLQACHQYGSSVASLRASKLLARSCTGISNFFGLTALLAGAVLGVGSLEVVRRRNYDAFITSHQIHAVWWFFACCHWPGCVAFCFPAIVFYGADAAHRRFRASASAAVAVRAHRATEGDRVLVATVAAPRPPTGGCPFLRKADDACGATIYVQAPRLDALVWKPFTVAGVVEDPRTGARAALVHVFDTGAEDRWTRKLCVAAAKAPTLELRFRGPMPRAPDAHERAALAGTPALLVGAGSGMTPALAFLRNVRDALDGGDASRVKIRLVLVVRDAALLECCDAFVLPRGPDGATAEPWLSTEVHVTRAVFEPREPAASAPADARPMRSGPVSLRRDARNALVAERARWPANAPLEAPAPSHDGSMAVDEAWALVGAFSGYAGAAYGLVWRDAAPLARSGPTLLRRGATGNPNLVSGGLAVVLCAAAAYACAAAALAAADALRRRARTTAASAAPLLGEAPPPADDGDGAPFVVHLASDGARPDVAAAVDRADAALGADAAVLAGGPPALLAALGARCRKRAVVALTFQM